MNKLRKDDETNLLLIGIFEYNFKHSLCNIKQFKIIVAPLLSNRFSLTKTHITHYERENYDSIEEHCALEAVEASAAYGMNEIGNATKPLQLYVFDVTGSSAANLFAMVFGLEDQNKQLTLDFLYETNRIGARRINNPMSNDNMFAITIANNIHVSSVEGVYRQ